jgi:conjugative transfer pilus assembly protein TraH
MSDNIVARTPQTPADIGFINNTTEPVYKMLAVANAVPGSNTAETLIETYKDVIALDYAETFLNANHHEDRLPRSSGIPNKERRAT